MANECTPYWQPGSAVTGRASAAVTGKRFVAVSGNPTGGDASTGGIPTIATAGAGVKPVGVSAMDVASGTDVLVWTQPGTILPVTAGAAITAGQEVQSDAAGAAIPVAAGRPAGLALSDAANGADVMVKFY